MRLATLPITDKSRFQEGRLTGTSIQALAGSIGVGLVFQTAGQSETRPPERLLDTIGQLGGFVLASGMPQIWRFYHV